MKPIELAPEARWRGRFRAPAIAWARVAKSNPNRGLACCNRSGRYQLCAWEVESGKLAELTHLETGTRMGTISADGKWVDYLEDRRGDESGHLTRVSFEGGEARDITPDLPAYFSGGTSEDLLGEVTGFTTSNREGFRVYVADRDFSVRREIFHSKRQTLGPRISSDGSIAVIGTAERSKRNEYALVAVDITTGERIAEIADDNASLSMSSFSRVVGDNRVLAMSDRSGLNRPFLWDPVNARRTELALDALDGELRAWDWSPDGRQLLLCRHIAATHELYLYDLETETCTRLDVPPGSVASGQLTAAGDVLICWQDASHPARILSIDPTGGRDPLPVLSAGDVEPGAPWLSITEPSTDGAEIQFWIAVPEGDGPFPTIVHTHGGPTAVQSEVFSPSAQAWLDHGFAFVSVNYRGSVTFGKEFERAIWGRLGIVEVDDMAAALSWAVSNEISDPDRVILTGGSYGGYLTLQAMGRRPDLWAGGIAQVAIADWRLMYEDQREALRAYQVSLFEGTPDEQPEAHAEASPITYADDFQAPILVIQGRNDSRCPARQMEVFEEALASRQKDIHIHWFDAGHGSLDVAQQIEHQEMMLKFAERILNP